VEGLAACIAADEAPFLAGQEWRFVRCDACGQAFHRYVLDAEWNERRFTRWMSHEAIKAFEETFDSPERDFRVASERTAHVLRIERLTRTIRKEGEPVRVCDFGCGYGEFLAICGAFGFKATGVDRAAARREHGQVEILSELDRSQSFHAVTLFEVLEHLDDPLAVLKDLVAQLLGGGIAIIETPNCQGVTGIATREDYLKIHPLDHINAFTPASLEAMAKRAGLIRIVPPASLVTTDAKRATTNLLKPLLPIAMNRTQQYFRKP